MLFSLPRFVYSVALFLLPVTAFAEPAVTSTVKSPQVQIKVEFVITSTTDVDNLGINFDLVPLAATVAGMPQNQNSAYLQIASGNRAAQLYQVLARTRGKVIQVPSVTADDGSAAVIRVDESVPDASPQSDLPRFGSFPTLRSTLQVQGELVFVPHVHPDHSVTLGLALTPDAASPKAASGRPALLKTIPSGDMIVFSNLIIGQDIPILGGLFRTRNKTLDTQELLIFITPTIISTDAQTGAAEPRGLPDSSLPSTSSKTVSIDVFQGDLRAVLAMLERQTGLKASVVDTGRTYRPVYVHLNNASLTEALGAVARSAGAQIVRDERGIYVFSPLPGAAQSPIPAAPSVGGQSVTIMP